MKIIKLTSVDTGEELYVNTSHIIAYWRWGATSTRLFLTKEVDYATIQGTPKKIITKRADYVTVQETPKKILQLIEYN